MILRAVCLIELIQHSRRRKAKCDGLRPTCARCRRRKENCIWPPGPSLRNTAPTVPIEETPSHALPSPGRAGSPALIQVVNSATSATSDGPPLALSKYALEIFLKQHHDLEFCSFIHKPSFMIESAHPFLISSMITLSSLYFPESVAHENGFRSVSQMTGWYLAATRRYSREESETPTGKFAFIHPTHMLSPHMQSRCTKMEGSFLNSSKSNLSLV
jgi:hypothetical protein